MSIGAVPVRAGNNGPIISTRFEVSTPAELTGVGAVNGALVMAQATRLPYRFLRDSALTPDGREVIQGVSGQWLLQNVGHESWRRQLDWNLSEQGNDDNPGSAGLPIKTQAELKRRWGPSPKLSGGNVAINILNSLSEAQPPFLEVEFAGDNTLRVLGTPSLLYSGSLTAAYVAPNKATAQRSQITDAAVGDFTTRGYQRGRMMNGAQVGATFGIIKRTAATVAFTTSVMVINPSSALPALAPTIVSPANGDLWQMDQLPILQNLRIRVKKPGGTNTALIVDSLEFASGASPLFDADCVVGTGLRAFVLRCVFRNQRTRYRNVTEQGCLHANLWFSQTSGEVLIYGSGVLGFAQFDAADGTFSIDGLTVFQGGQNNAGGIAVPGTDAPGLLTVRKPVGSMSGSNGGANGGFGCFDSRSEAGFRLNAGASASFPTADALLYGTGNAQYGVAVRPGAVLAFDGIEPTVTGAVGDASIVGVGTAWGALPAFTAGTIGCGVVGV